MVDPGQVTAGLESRWVGAGGSGREERSRRNSSDQIARRSDRTIGFISRQPEDPADSICSAPLCPRRVFVAVG